MLSERLTAREHDPADPDPWLALYLDASQPLDPEAKAALVLNSESRSRQFLLPLIRPVARLAIAAIQVLKIFLPGRWAAPRLLHRLIWRGLRRWVRPEANTLILRHFHIGSEILAFVADNLPGTRIETSPLRPRRLEDVRDGIFVQHDLNLFNFVIRLNRALEAAGTAPAPRPPHELDFRSISDGPFELDPMPDGPTNRLDLESALELYTPLYQLLLTDRDFWRATNSLQLDESIALVVSQLLGDPLPATLVSNRHPLVPESTLGAAHRLMLHGLQAEMLHALLVRYKRRAGGQRSS